MRHHDTHADASTITAPARRSRDRQGPPRDAQTSESRGDRRRRPPDARARTAEADAEAVTLTALTQVQRPDRAVHAGTRRGTTMLRHSLTALGAGRSIVVDKHGTVIVGDKTVAEARALALPIAVVRSDGTQLVVVQRVDLTATDPRARQLAIADNRTAEVNLAWDADVLRALHAASVTLAPWWTDAELVALVGGDLFGADRALDTVAVPRRTDLRIGDLITLGPHRLLCGDATQADHVARVLDGVVPPLMVTDPPYGVRYDPAWRVGVDGSPRHALGPVHNDDRSDWGDAFALFPGDVCYVWHAGLHAGRVAESLERHGFALRAQIIWNKGTGVLSRGHYHWQHEPCWYAVRGGAAAGWHGDRTQTTVWDIPHLNPVTATPSPVDAPTGHATQKPVRLLERPILNHTAAGDTIYDPFAGSGSLLIAATITQRRACVIELDPMYVQAIVDRWVAVTGSERDIHVVRG